MLRWDGALRDREGGVWPDSSFWRTDVIARDVLRPPWAGLSGAMGSTTLTLSGKDLLARLNGTCDFVRLDCNTAV